MADQGRPRASIAVPEKTGRGRDGHPQERHQLPRHQRQPDRTARGLPAPERRLTPITITPTDPRLARASWHDHASRAGGGRRLSGPHASAPTLVFADLARLLRDISYEKGSEVARDSLVHSRKIQDG